MSAADDANLEVWNLQEKVYHYRIPVWDRLVERSAGRYRLTVLGATDQGRAFGSREGRPYIRELPLVIRRFLGQPMNWWPELRAIVEAERPGVVLVNPNPRTVDCWTLPGLLRRQGGVSIGWTKVRSYSGLPAGLLSMTKRTLFHRYDLMAVYGAQARTELIELGYPDERIAIAQNTIDTDYIWQHEIEIREAGRRLREAHDLLGRRLLVYVGQVVPKKRVGDLLDAWPALRELDPALTLVVVGGGSALRALRERAADLDPARIRVAGRVPEGEDFAWIAAADWTIQCGAVGLAINQSLALGVPTIIADEPGSDSELVEDGETGWRFAKGDPAAITEVVRRLLADPERAAAVAARGRAHVRARASIETMVDALDEIIRRGVDLAARDGAACDSRPA